ncbi:BRCA1-associated ATM activator 1 isoform X2 [Clupea harengus]|uniref:BRCA1-associated ATM activator 1 isoform X2 n=1 Tax=Clupea harengus TaxID=7950 RepID=A0A6P8F0E5_CLUHA|nr:BRCA1-associated ATM activator 1 isoform X2 [Clupea harengus]
MSQGTMDSNCIALLPGVLTFLSDPKQSLPDDTCLEKLLDWLTSIINEDDDRNLLDQQPCLLEFISSMCESKTTDPIILSFTLKLTGLLAATKKGFSRLEERGVVRVAFAREGGAVREQWEEASVRCGWLLGLRRMLEHHRAMLFISENALTKLILQSQCEKSLFVAAAANQLLAQILNFHHPPITAEQTAQENGHSSPEWITVTTEIVGQVGGALVSQEHFRVLQALRLLALSLPGCRAPLLGSVWRVALGPLEVLVEAQTNNLSLPVMEVLQAAATTELFSQSEARVEELMRATLKERDPKTAIRCASAIIRQQHCSEPLKRMAVGIVLQPLEFITGSPLQTLPSGSGDAKEVSGLQPVLEDQLSQRSMCISLLSLSLSSVAELSLSNSLFVDAPVQPVTEAVLQLLKVSLGQSPSPAPYNKSFVHLIGCSRVQRCGLDALISLSSCEGQGLRQEVLNVLLQYLQSPDSDPTVLQKTLQALLKWICSEELEECTQTHLFTQNLFPALMKRVCDVHWEVRDSTLEFITELTVNSRDSAAFSSAVWGSGIVSLLLACLDDSESYVRASAISALSQAVTTPRHQGAPNANSPHSLPDEVLTRLTDILAQDDEAFPRRAVVKAFIAWLSGPRPPPSLDQSLPGLLALGIDDLDWEVKVHTLALTETLMDKTLSRCSLAEALGKLQEYGAFSVFFKGLLDCDRPVAQKSCQLLLRLREVIKVKCESAGSPGDTPTFQLQSHQWGKDLLRKWKGVDVSDWSAEGKPEGHWPKEEVSLREVVSQLDLEGMQQALMRSSDHVMASPQSLMEDILAVTQQGDDNAMDCY